MTDNVVVQARSSSALKSTMLIELADAIDGKPGWRLELAVVNTPVTPDLPHNGELVPNERVETLLRDARALVTEKRLEAALLTGWAAAEAVLRRLAQTKGVDAEKKGSGTILKQVLVFGLITPDQYMELSRAMDARNAFAHGFTAQIDAEAVDRFLKEIDVLRAPRAA